MLSFKDLTNVWFIARPINLVIAFLTFFFASYLSFEGTIKFIYRYDFWLEGFLMLWIMSCGYWINDVFDFKIDEINKPRKTIVGKYISPKKLITIYISSTILIVSISFLLPIQFIIINVLSIVLLYFYSAYFKAKAMIGNILIALLVCMVFILGSFFNQVKGVHLWGVIFSFLLTLIREILKDLEDMKGDIKYGLMTLPITIGVKMTKNVLFVILIVLIISCDMPLLYHYITFQPFHNEYLYSSLMLVQIPLVVVIGLLVKSNSKADYTQLSRFVKLIYLSGLLTLVWLNP